MQRGDAPIFYCWQSDLPSDTNQAFVEACIEGAIRDVNATAPVGQRMYLDRDIRNRSGSADIADSIFDKITCAHLVVADTSIVIPPRESPDPEKSAQRRSPNPNVLVELGYAAAKHGWERIICVFNQAYGDLSELPFDLRNRKVLPYDLGPTRTSVAEHRCRAELTEALAQDLLESRSSVPRAMEGTTRNHIVARRAIQPVALFLCMVRPTVERFAGPESAEAAFQETSTALSGVEVTNPSLGMVVSDALATAPPDSDIGSRTLKGELIPLGQHLASFGARALQDLTDVLSAYGSADTVDAAIIGEIETLKILLSNFVHVTQSAFISEVAHIRAAGYSGKQDREMVRALFDRIVRFYAVMAPYRDVVS